MYLPLCGLKISTIDKILSEHSNHNNLLVYSFVGVGQGYIEERLLIAKHDLTIIENYNDVNHENVISEKPPLEIYTKYFHRFIEEYKYGKSANSWNFAKITHRRPNSLTFYFEGQTKLFRFFWTAEEINLMQKRYRCMLTLLEMLLGEPIVPYNDVK
jgi:hypothetical protein